MTSPDKIKKGSTNNGATSSSAEKLAAMRPSNLLPGRTIKHSADSSDTYWGRPITESDHSLGRVDDDDDE